MALSALALGGMILATSTPADAHVFHGRGHGWGGAIGPELDTAALARSGRLPRGDREQSAPAAGAPAQSSIETSRLGDCQDARTPGRDPAPRPDDLARGGPKIRSNMPICWRPTLQSGIGWQTHLANGRAATLTGLSCRSRRHGRDARLSDRSRFEGRKRRNRQTDDAPVRRVVPRPGFEAGSSPLLTSFYSASWPPPTRLKVRS